MDPDQPYKERELLHNISRKDMTALRQVYMLYFRQLSFFAQKLTGDQLVAEDIVADTFLKLYEKDTAFESEGQLRSFLFTIVRNAAFDYLRARERRKVIHEGIQSNAQMIQPSSDIALIRTEAMNIIYSEILKLPPQCGEVIRLSFVEGKTIPEIASIMNLAYKTVQNQKARGLQLLRAAIANRGLSSLVLILKLFIIASR